MTIPQHPWDKVLIDGHAPLVRARRVFRYLPIGTALQVVQQPVWRTGRAPSGRGRIHPVT
jgi:hypothetical protein